MQNRIAENITVILAIAFEIFRAKFCNFIKKDFLNLMNNKMNIGISSKIK